MAYPPVAAPYGLRPVKLLRGVPDVGTVSISYVQDVRTGAISYVRDVRTAAIYYVQDVRTVAIS